MSLDDDFSKYFIVRDVTVPTHHCRSGLSSWFEDNGKIKVLVYPGDACNTPKDANAMCKRAQKIIGERLAKRCEFYSVWYPNSNKDVGSIAYRTQKMFDTLFVPLLAQKTPTGDIKILPEEKISANLQNRINITHCYGSYIVEAMDREIFSFLRNLGMDYKTVGEMQKNLLSIHNNDLSENVGKVPMHGTHIYRMTQSDEKRSAADYELDTFQNYFRRKKLADDDVLFVPLSANEHALIVSTVTLYGNDHNGGYWREQKADSGVYEELFLRTILAEKIEDDKKFVSIDEYIERALKKYPFSASFIKGIADGGKKMGQEFADYKKDIYKEFSDLKQSVLSETCCENVLERSSYKALLLQDDFGNMLIDYAVLTDNPILMQNVWKAMTSRLPYAKDVSNKTLENANIKNAWQKQEILAQKMIDDDNPKGFMAFCDANLDLTKLSYDKARSGIVPILVNRVNAISAQKSTDADNFYKLAVIVYGDAAKNNAEKYTAKLEEDIFNPENIANASQLRMILKHCADFGVKIKSLETKQEAAIFTAKPLAGNER